MELTADSQSGIDKIPPLKILVVDDDALNQRMMQLLLTREGHQVDLASDGLEALEAVKLQKYDIVFMDLQMPFLDGVETSRRIREWENGERDVFIVALTASYLPEEGQVLFEAGIDNYISKPFNIDHIRRLLKYSFKVRGFASPDQVPNVEQKLLSEKVLDIEKGVVQVGGDLTTYKELLGYFVEGLPQRLQVIQSHFASLDLVGLSRAAHNLSGIAASLGALQLSAYARMIDKQSVDGYTESLRHLLQEIQFAIGKLLEISNDFLAEKKSLESV